MFNQPNQTPFQRAVEAVVYYGCGGLDHGNLQVLKSAAGYYVGHLYYDKDAQAWWPYDRQSDGYWNTREEAQHYCDVLKSDD